MKLWKLERVANERARKGYSWQVTCPNPPAEMSWANDFRPARCDCRRFPTEGKAMRYIQRMETSSQSNESKES
jgi:hypothetical protein